MRLLFWNLYKKENSKYVTSLLLTKQIDVAIFAEYGKLSCDKVIANAKGYTFVQGMGGNDKIIAVKRGNIDLNVKREQSRYTLYDLRLSDKTVVLAGVHLQANPYATSFDRALTLNELAMDIKSLEKETNTNNTIVIGDFNANPFSTEMISKKGLNAVLFMDLINNQEVVQNDGKKFRRFYNPTLMVLSEDNKVYGSHYYGSGSAPLYWNLYDQVVIRKGLARSIVEIEYCKFAGNSKLITTKGLPSKAISDHLPLYVEVTI